MPFRPALIPEPVRPLVLFPIYLVKDFVKIIFSITLTCNVVIGFIIATVPLSATLPWVLRILFTAALTSIFATAFYMIRKQRMSLLALLVRTEDVAAGDIIAATLLAAELSSNTAQFAADQTMQAMDAIASVNVGDAAGTATNVTVGAANVAADAAASAAGAVVDLTGSVLDASVNTVGSVASVAGSAVVGSVGVGGDVAGEAMRLLANPGDGVGCVANISQSATTMAVNTGVQMAGAAAETGNSVVNVTGEVGMKMVDVGGTVAMETGSLAMAGVQKLMELDPVFIFKRVVRLVLKAASYAVIGLPIGLLLGGDVLCRIGIQLNGMELEALGFGLGLVGIPAFFWVRRKALLMLDHASEEIARIETAVV